jgi:hypothetical protein
MFSTWEGKRGQVQFAGTARRVLSTNWTCPLFPTRQRGLGDAENFTDYRGAADHRRGDRMEHGPLSSGLGDGRPGRRSFALLPRRRCVNGRATGTNEAGGIRTGPHGRPADAAGTGRNQGRSSRHVWDRLPTCPGRETINSHSRLAGNRPPTCSPGGHAVGVPRRPAVAPAGCGNLSAAKFQHGHLPSRCNARLSANGILKPARNVILTGTDTKRWSAKDLLRQILRFAQDDSHVMGQVLRILRHGHVFAAVPGEIRL